MIARHFLNLYSGIIYTLSIDLSVTPRRDEGCQSSEGSRAAFKVVLRWRSYNKKNVDFSVKMTSII
jgi:hypothetical protein